jgi:hypothetical protein
MAKKKLKKDWYFLGLALLFFVLGAIYSPNKYASLSYLAGWTMIIVEIFYVLIKSW